MGSPVRIHQKGRHDVCLRRAVKGGKRGGGGRLTSGVRRASYSFLSLAVRSSSVSRRAGEVENARDAAGLTPREVEGAANETKERGAMTRRASVRRVMLAM